MPRMVAAIFSTRGNSLNARRPGPELLIASLVLKLVFHSGELKMRPCGWPIFKGLVEFLANALWAALLSLYLYHFRSFQGPASMSLCLGVFSQGPPCPCPAGTVLTNDWRRLVDKHPGSLSPRLDTLETCVLDSLPFPQRK